DRAARASETACRFAGVLGRILDHGYSAERPFARGEACDRTLRVSIDDRRVASIKMPMNRKAACERTFAAAALHRRHRDDRAHLPSFPRPSTQRIIRINFIFFFETCLPGRSAAKNKRPAGCGDTVWKRGAVNRRFWRAPQPGGVGTFEPPAANASGRFH